MEILEEILKNKKKVILLIGMAIVIIIIAGIMFIENSKNSDSIDILEKIGQDIEVTNNQGNMQENIIGENEIIETVEQKEKIAIHITGEVKKTGILYLEAGARIVDAIKAAGGATKEANLDQVNLAYILEDGQKIYIPNKKEKIEKEAYIITNSGQNVLIEQGKSSTETEKNTKGGKEKVNINHANQTELETLTGIGPSLAQRIIEYRENNGEFKKIEDIQNVKGIGDSKYSNIKDSICI